LHYRLFGCDVASDFALPGLPEALGEPDVRIRHGAVPDRLSRPRGGGVCFSAAPGEALVVLPAAGRLHVRHGHEIVVEPAEGATEGVLRMFLLNLAFGVLLHQRGDLVLHAAAVEGGGGCIALAGASSSGKSTVAAALHARGCRVLTDELCVVGDDGDGGPTVVPGPPCLQVWADALNRLGHDVDRLELVRAGVEKYLLPLGTGHVSEPLPLRAIYVLAPWNGDGIEAEPLLGQRRLEALVRNTYRREYLRPMGLGPRHFRRIATLARRVPLVRVRRPARSDAVDDGLEALAPGLEQRPPAAPGTEAGAVAGTVEPSPPPDRHESGRPTTGEDREWQVTL
jgi:hypothetical protein